MTTASALTEELSLRDRLPCQTQEVSMILLEREKMGREKKAKKIKREEVGHLVPKLLPCGFGEPAKTLKEDGSHPQR